MFRPQSHTDIEALIIIWVNEEKQQTTTIVMYNNTYALSSKVPC